LRSTFVYKFVKFSTPTPERTSPQASGERDLEIAVSQYHPRIHRVPFFLYFFLSQSDLVPLPPIHCWRSGLLQLITVTHTLGRIPLDEGSTLRRDLYLTLTTDRQPGLRWDLKPANPKCQRTQHHDLDGRATGVGSSRIRSRSST
jgi:hypothetical protein